jgi:hypothetical protein
MKRTLLLFLCFLPGFLMAQMVNGKYVPPAADTTVKQAPVQEENEQPQQKKVKKAQDKSVSSNTPYDWKKNGFFHALFHVGVNFSQIDGDQYAGFNKVGFDGGAGVLVRFHKYLSASMELNYTQWGARYSFSDKPFLYNTNLNYAQIPVSLNVHDKEIVMVGVGISPQFLVGYKEIDEAGVNITDTVHPQPKKFDLDVFVQGHIIIKKQFCIGVKYSYSMMPFRGLEYRYIGDTKIHGEYNNVITLRLMYILSAWKRK